MPDIRLSYEKEIFGKKNFIWKTYYILMFVSLSIVTLGFILMSGGGSDNPDFFNTEIFNFRRIRLAPTMVIIGFGIAVLSIFTNPDP